MDSQVQKEIEMIVLGSMMLSKSWRQAAMRIQPEIFTVPAHQIIFKGFQKLAAEKAEFSFPMLCHAIGDQLQDAGTDGYLLQLSEFTPGASVLETNIAKLSELHARREIAKIGKQAMDTKFELQDLVQGIQRVHEAMLPQSRSIVGHVSRFSRTKLPQGMPSTFDFINKYSSVNGYPVGQTAIVMGYTGAGKTQVLIQEALHFAQLGFPVLYIILADIDGLILHSRMRQQLTGYAEEPRDSFECEKWHQIVKELNELPIEIADVRQDRYDQSIESISFRVKQFKARCKKRGVVIIDYCQKIRTLQKMSALEASTFVSLECQQLASEVDMPLILGSQVTEGEDRDVTKGSRSWEEDAGLLLLIKRVEDKDAAKRMKIPIEYHETKGLTLLNLKKSRFGESARALAQFVPRFAKFDVIAD